LVIHGRGELWVCALVAAAFIGPTMSASRSYLARAAPPQQQGQLFGLYTCTGRVVSFVAPAAFALGVSILGGQRWGMLGITVVLLAGLLAVLPVRAVDCWS
jgi:MFS transporter, UMF1 family